MISQVPTSDGARGGTKQPGEVVVRLRDVQLVNVLRGIHARHRHLSTPSVSLKNGLAGPHSTVKSAGSASATTTFNSTGVRRRKFLKTASMARIEGDVVHRHVLGVFAAKIVDGVCGVRVCTRSVHGDTDIGDNPTGHCTRTCWLSWSAVVQYVLSHSNPNSGVKLNSLRDTGCLQTGWPTRRQSRCQNPTSRRFPFATRR